MPYTLAHPAAILPFVNRKYFSVSALIAGSIVPDMEFYLRLRETNNFGHSGWGVLLFDIPIALLMCYVFHTFIRNKLIANSPDFLIKRFDVYTTFNWISYAKSNALAVVYSVLLGIATHFLLDFFTHSKGFLPFYFEWLDTVLHFPGYEIPVYSFLQISLSIIGLALILKALLKIPISVIDIVQAENKSAFWLLLISFTVAVFTLRLIVLPEHLGFWDLFIAVNGSIIYATLLTSFFFYKTKITHGQ